MAHNIFRSNMFYVGEKPWHGIGTKLDSPATAREAIIAAGINYSINKEPLVHNGIRVPDKFANVRRSVDGNAVLGIVGSRYRVIQNIDAFRFFDNIVGDGQAIYHTAGALGQGERIWILAKLPNDLVIGREDIVEKYLVLMNSHDGSSTLRLYFTPVRVVCENTLNMSLGDASSGISIPHVGNIGREIEEARRILGISINWYAEWEKIAKQLKAEQVTEQAKTLYFSDLVFGSSGEPGSEERDAYALRKESPQLQNRFDQLQYLFEKGKGNGDGSWWSAYNSVTEYADHYKTVRNLNADPTKRLNDAWFGTGARLKADAFNKAVALAGIEVPNAKR
jgi:phage/plasmid-like protein (TIGR03299 family)